MTDDLTFQFTLDPAEQVRVGSLVARRTRGGRLWRWVGLPFLALPFLLALLLDWPLEFLRPYLIVLAVAGLVALLAPAIQRWKVRRAFAITPSLQGPLTYRFTDAGLALETAVSSGLMAWEGVREAVETKDMFLLYIAPGYAYYVPKRIVGTHAGALRRFLHRRLGARAAGVGLNSGGEVT